MKKHHTMDQLHDEKVCQLHSEKNTQCFAFMLYHLNSFYPTALLHIAAKKCHLYCYFFLQYLPILHTYYISLLIVFPWTIYFVNTNN